MRRPLRLPVYEGMETLLRLDNMFPSTIREDGAVIIPVHTREPLVYKPDLLCTLSRNGKMHRVHRRLCEEINGPPPTEDHQAAHSCGKGKSGCVTKNHLSWKTPKENNADKIGHGTSGRGESHNLSKLTEEQVVEIRSLRGIEKIKSTASRYGVSMSQVSRIQLGYNWGWLKI